MRSSNLAPGTLLPFGASKDKRCSHTCRTNAPSAPTSSHQRRCPELRRLEPTIATKNPWYQVANFYIAPMNFFHAFLLISNCDHCWSLQGRRAQLYIHTTRACVHIFATRISQQICGSALAAVVFVALYIRFACLLVCLSPKKKRPHAPGTHATRRNIAVAIPLAFNKRLQQHMRSTTMRDLDVAKKTELLGVGPPALFQGPPLQPV